MSKKKISSFNEHLFTEKERYESDEKISCNFLREKLRERHQEILEMEDKISDLEILRKRNEKKMQRNIDMLTEEIEDLKEEIESKKMKSIECNAKINNLKNKIVKLKEENEAYEKEIKMLKNKNQEIKNILEEESRKIDSEVQKMKDVMKNEIDKLKGTILKLESSNISLNDTSNEIQLKSQSAVEKLKKKIDKIRNENHSMELKISSLNNLLEESCKNETVLRSTNEHLNSLLKDQQFTIGDQESKICQLEKLLSEERTVNKDVYFQVETNAIPEFTTHLKERKYISDETTAICPNCGDYFIFSMVEEHLKLCLED